MKNLLLSGIIVISSLLASQSSKARLDTNGCTSMGLPYVEVILGASISSGSLVLDHYGWNEIEVTTNTYSNCFPSGLAVLIGSSTELIMEADL